MNAQSDFKNLNNLSLGGRDQKQKLNCVAVPA